MIKFWSVCISILLFSSYSQSQTWMPSFFSDNMVLQHNDSVAIWGKDNPNTLVMIYGSWGQFATTVSDQNGYWKVKLVTAYAGGPYSLYVKGSTDLILNNILLGEVWFCSGQSNMEMPVKGYPGQPVINSNEMILESRNNNIRFFHTPRTPSIRPAYDVNSSWEIAEPATTLNFSAVAYSFAKRIQHVLGIPVGIIQSAWGGSTIESWMDIESLDTFSHIQSADTFPKANPNRSPCTMFNSMINPYIGYTIKGVLWYQGESNKDNAHQYEPLFSSLILSWRKHWKQGNFPFYFVQIAPYEMGKSNGAFLREAQLEAMLHVPNTGMVVTLDIGEKNEIHPSQKEQIGNRLAYWALAKTYNIKGIAFSGPIFKAMEKKLDGKMLLTFEYAQNGLTSFGDTLVNFEISGIDRIFYNATAIINRDNPSTVLVWNDSIRNPVSVRYAFKSWVKASLFNTEGLPASSFRTDKW